MTIDEERLVGFALLVVVFGTAVAAGPALAVASFDPAPDRQFDRPHRSVGPANQVNVSVPGGDGEPLPMQQEDTPTATETTTVPSTETTTDPPTGTTPSPTTGTDTTTPAETEPSSPTATTTETAILTPARTETATDAEPTTEAPSPTETDTSGARFGAGAPGNASEPDDPLLQHDVIVMALGIVGSVVIGVIGLYGAFLPDF